MVEAVVLAGRANRGAFRELSPVSNEALLPIAGRPMLEYVLTALGESEGVGGIVLVAPSEVAEACPGDYLRVEPGTDLVGNALAGLAAARSERVLLATSDLPLLRGWMVDRFLAAALGLAADAVYPIIPKVSTEAAYPGVRRTYVRLREGTFTGGNLFLLDRQAALMAGPAVRSLIALRKKPWRLAASLGAGFVWRLFRGSLTLAALEKRFSKLFGLHGRALVTEVPEIGLDVDKEGDLQLVNRHLAGTGGR